MHFVDDEDASEVKEEKSLLIFAFTLKIVLSLFRDRKKVWLKFAKICMIRSTYRTSELSALYPGLCPGFSCYSRDLRSRKNLKPLITKPAF